ALHVLEPDTLGYLRADQLFDNHCFLTPGRCTDRALGATQSSPVESCEALLAVEDSEPRWIRRSREGSGWKTSGLRWSPGAVGGWGARSCGPMPSGGRG